MNPVSLSVKDAYRISPRSPEELPEGPLSDIVLMLVDMAGSAAFFARGDAVGRETIRHFQTLTLGFLRESGGSMSRSRGDMVWAAFQDASEALRAAAGLQKRFAEHNRKRTSEERLRIRVGLHRGDLVVENQEAHGVTLHVLTRAVPLLDPDVVALTEMVLDRLDGDLAAACVPAGLTLPPDMPADLKFLRYEGEARAENDQRAPTAPPVILYVRPMKSMADESFVAAWRELGEAGPEDRNPWGEHSLLPDQSRVFLLEDAGSALALASRIRAFLRGMDDPGTRGDMLPLQILVDVGTFLRRRDGRVTVEGIDWYWLKPDTVYVTVSARKRLEDGQTPVLKPVSEDSGGERLFEVSGAEAKDSGPFPEFPYAGALVRGGRRSPCFYCDSRRHSPAKCPSKTRERRPYALERLGYRSPEFIVGLFLQYLLAREEEAGTPPGDWPLDLAEDAFYELRFIHQLRFFENLWGSTVQRWDDVTPPTVERKGSTGAAWLAHDCIRSGNYQRAAELLNTAIQTSPSDFRLYCCLGFLNIETGSPERAKGYFEQAFEHAATIPQRIFIRFLICRLARIQGGLADVPSRLDDVRALDPECPDVVYLRIVLDFHVGDRETAVGRLRRFVEENPSFFVRAFIDPDLAPFSSDVREALSPLYASARSGADEAMGRTDREIRRLKAILGTGMRVVNQLASEWKQARRVADGEGYQGFLDVLRAAKSLHVRIRKVIERRKESPTGDWASCPSDAPKSWRPWEAPLLTAPSSRSIPRSNGSSGKSRPCVPPSAWKRPRSSRPTTPGPWKWTGTWKTSTSGSGS